MKYLNKLFYIISLVIMLSSCGKDDKRQTLMSYSNANKFVERNITVLDTIIGSVSDLEEGKELNIKVEALISSIKKIRIDLTSLINKNKEFGLLEHQFSTDYMFKGENMVALRLKKEITDYRLFLFTILKDEEIKLLVKEQLETSNKKLANNISMTWESSQFEHVPIIGCIVNLNKLEYDIKSAQLLTLLALKKKESTHANTLEIKHGSVGSS